MIPVLTVCAKMVGIVCFGVVRFSFLLILLLLTFY
jgi:hypothetical protein